MMPEMKISQVTKRKMMTTTMMMKETLRILRQMAMKEVMTRRITMKRMTRTRTRMRTMRTRKKKRRMKTTMMKQNHHQLRRENKTNWLNREIVLECSIIGYAHPNM